MSQSKVLNAGDEHYDPTTEFERTKMVVIRNKIMYCRFWIELNSVRRGKG